MLTTVVIGSAAMFLLILSLTFILAKTVARSEFDRLSGEEECDLIDNEEFFDMDNERSYIQQEHSILKINIIRLKKEDCSSKVVSLFKNEDVVISLSGYKTIGQFKY